MPYALFSFLNSSHDNMAYMKDISVWRKILLGNQAEFRKSVQHGALSEWIDALFLTLRAVFHDHIQFSFLRYASNVV